MLYTRQIALDHPTWQKEGLSELDNLAHPEHSQILSQKLGKRLGSFAVFGTTFYDIAHHGNIQPDAVRAEVARQNALLSGTLELMDDAIDHPCPDRNAKQIEAFLNTCFSLMLSDQPATAEPFSAIALPDQQRACYDLSRYIRPRLQLDDPDKSHSLRRILVDELQPAAMAQLTATEPEKLLHLTEDITGACTEAATLISEFVDDQKYPDVMQAAWCLGAMSGVLDHGSEILDDLEEGTNTFATAYLADQGASRTTLNTIDTVREDEASDKFKQGLASLEGSSQRSIYKTAGRIVRMRYGVKRAKARVTPRKVEAVLAKRSQTGHEPEQTAA